MDFSDRNFMKILSFSQRKLLLDFTRKYFPKNYYKLIKNLLALNKASCIAIAFLTSSGLSKSTLSLVSWRISLYRVLAVASEKPFFFKCQRYSIRRPRVSWFGVSPATVFVSVAVVKFFTLKALIRLSSLSVSLTFKDSLKRRPQSRQIRL